MVKKNKRSRPSQKSAAQEKVRNIKIVVTIVTIALLWLFFAPGLGVISYLNKKSELKRVQAEALQLQKANRELQEEIDKLLGDPEYLEKVAREKYELLKPNERVYDFSRKTKKKKSVEQQEK